MLVDTGQVSRRRVYDSRVRELICATGNADLFLELNIPQSTIRGWLNGEFKTVVGTESAVRRLVAFYVQQHNEVMPHSALDYRTPDEVYFGRAEEVPVQLAVDRQAAREARVATNRAMTCETCSIGASSTTLANAA